MIKPVDFQVLIPKSAEIARITSEEQQKNQAMMQQQESSVQHKAEDNLRQVHSREKAQESKIKEKQEKRQGGKKEEKKKKYAYKKDNKEDINPDLRTSIIDIKI